ncbi:RNA polymerase sigma factor [Planctomyces sp. SH-PL62]|uniref:RNA polymerase sigma factor n=1 Tax=Planctomyces sp. SH-PL62 TaxID=1636152 RepID=UPI00078ED3A9|nr:sigma-70 family RNA polymerase sigma factor [Planctomyces sp. SH-PL62]AMV36304.1 ECF RNA polymerase sigma factor SigW [Planctomyces sp. SH-PL62]
MTRLTGTRRDELACSIERLFDAGSVVGLTESQLLERFASRRDEGAFAAIVERHGPMVLGVCRRSLRDPHDAEDAFQAVFLILARKAGGLRCKEQVGNWLYGVACRVAARARVESIRRRAKVATTDDGARLEVDVRKPSADDPAHALACEEEWVRLHEEIRRLPGRYRGPVVACYFEGRTHEEAAALLACPVGTVKGRLARARDLLRRRLGSPGAAVLEAVLATAFASAELRAGVPASLATETVHHALALAAAPSVAWMTTPALSLSVRTLTEGVLQAMFLTQIKMASLAAILASTGLLVAGASFASSQDGADDGREFAATTATTVPEKAGSPIAKATATQTKQTVGGGGMGGMGMMPGMMMGGGGASEPSPAEVRQKIAGLSASISNLDENPQNEALREALASPFTLRTDEDHSTLGGLLDQIKGSVKTADGKKIPIYVDPVGLEEAGASLDSPVSIDLEDVPLKFSLRLMLKQIGLAYCVRDGVLIISSLEGVQQELLEAQRELMGLHPDKVIMGPDGPSFGFGGMGGMGGGRGGMGQGMR